MEFPAIDDTILAVSSGWAASPVGIVRLSGRDSFALVRALGVPPPGRDAVGRAHWTSARLPLVGEVALPATVFWFGRPRSYTGQDVVELHTVGCLPLLRELCARLLALGARRALPGEFTARAFLFGKLDAAQVEDVLALLRAGGAAGARQAERAARMAQRRMVSAARERIADVLALLEAGIDFTEEQDVRFVTASEVRAALDDVLRLLAESRARSQPERCAGQPHVALVGLPNAGKSTLFNALVGSERAIVSPVLGTTRDVLAAEVEIGGVSIRLQDCAGLGESVDELELAAHLAAERAADQADLVLWVHAADTPWLDREAQALSRIPAERRLLVWSKGELVRPGGSAMAGPGLPAAIQVSAVSGAGLAALRDAICRQLSASGAAGGEPLAAEQLAAVSAAVERAQALTGGTASDEVEGEELVALELRTACVLLSESDNGSIVEDFLGRIFSQFCLGK